MKSFILFSLLKLSKKMNKLGYLRISNEIDDIIKDLIEYLNNESQENDDTTSLIVNTVGLRGDTKPEQPMGGFSVEPLFFDGTNLD